MEDKLSAARKIANVFLDNPILRKFIPNPANYPEVIYKYRCWKDVNHKRLLTENELYMSPAKFFNDPYDLKIYRNFQLLDTPEKLKEYVDRCMVEHPAGDRAVLEERVSNILKYQVRSEVIEDQSNNLHYGTACFSKQWKSILMWSHYADNHKGFCMGFDEPRMRVSELFGKGGDVAYTSEYPNIHPYDSDEKAAAIRTYIKSDLWKYEEEYRLMNIYFDGGGAEHDSPKRVVKLPANFAVELLLGASMPKCDREELTAIARDKGIKVYQVEKVPFKFEMDRYLIE